VVTSFGGGFNGTGVPLAIKKFRFDQKIKNKPRIMKGEERYSFKGTDNSFGNRSHLSSIRNKTNSPMMILKKSTTPSKVDGIRTFGLLVAILLI
jgi:hypothetical protein